MSKTVYVVGTGAFGAIVFTTKRNALDFVFQDNDSLFFGDYETIEITKSQASKELKDDKQIYIEHDSLGDVTIEKSLLLTGNETIRY